MSSYASPTFPTSPIPYNAPTPLPETIAAPYVPITCPTVHVAHHHHKKPHRVGYNDIGSILVLFILLVIISRACIV